MNPWRARAMEFLLRARCESTALSCARYLSPCCPKNLDRPIGKPARQAGVDANATCAQCRVGLRDRMGEFGHVRGRRAYASIGSNPPSLTLFISRELPRCRPLRTVDR